MANVRGKIFCQRCKTGNELMLKGSRSAYFDHALLETLLTVLTESGIIDRRKLEAAWRERSGSDEGLEGSKRRRRELCEKVVAEYKGDARAEFARLVGEGVEEH